MVYFSIYFIFCNIFISILLCGILLVRKLLENTLSPVSRYRLWYLLPVILALPFSSVRPAGLPRFMHLIHSIKNSILPAGNTPASSVPAGPLSADLIKDLSISVTRTSAPAVFYLPLILWIGGMLAVILFMIRSRIRLYQIECSALPLQNQKVRTLYLKCLTEARIKRHIPLYSTAFLKSPAIAVLLRPRIYVPIHLIQDLHEKEMRYMLLHELQHYKQKDAVLNCLMHLAVMVYWLNPLIWHAWNEIRTDRETACDTRVLRMLDAGEYADYGNTLLNFAQKTASPVFQMTAGIGGSASQLRTRILNIISYQPKDKCGRIKEHILLAAAVILLLESTALIPVTASDTAVSLPADTAVYAEDLSDFFAGQEGCFVLYDTKADSWHIYNESLAVERFSPDSTYKIYSALSALENGSISPASSFLAWDGQTYPFSEWNRDQTLAPAMRNSVNWYFQKLDQKTGQDALEDFYRTIGYGNQDLSGGISSFWLESSLQISTLEQAQLLKDFYHNACGFSEDNVQAVKDALVLSSSGSAVLSGKTGTGIVNGKSIRGWFIGYVESADNTWFFAVNIQGADHAGGQRAAEIALNILQDKYIYYTA